MACCHPWPAATRGAVMTYGVCAGRDTLRCLALATVDNPVKKEDMDLVEASKFVKYEVRGTLGGLRPSLSGHFGWSKAFSGWSLGGPMPFRGGH